MKIRLILPKAIYSLLNRKFEGGWKRLALNNQGKLDALTGERQPRYPDSQAYLAGWDLICLQGQWGLLEESREK
jgi:hypothetical protein